MEVKLSFRCSECALSFDTILLYVQLVLIDKTDVSWWTMKTSNGKQGLVPVNYIDKLDTVEEKQVDDHTDDGDINRTSSDTSVSNS